MVEGLHPLKVYVRFAGGFIHYVYVDVARNLKHLVYSLTCMLRDLRRETTCCSSPSYMEL